MEIKLLQLLNFYQKIINYLKPIEKSFILINPLQKNLPDELKKFKLEKLMVNHLYRLMNKKLFAIYQ